MRKVFLYLYPIKEYFEKVLDVPQKEDEKFALSMLNSTIDKRYRKKEYEIVFSLYPDKELYGIDQKYQIKLFIPTFLLPN